MGDTPPEQGGTGDITSYEALNKLVSEGYSSLTAEIITLKGYNILTDTYDIEKLSDGKRITYHLTRLATFDEVDGELVIPDAYYIKYEGTVTVKDGVVTPSADAEGFNEADFISADLPALSFKEEYFSNPSFGDGEFSAAVKSPAEFFGRSVSATDMRVEVKYTSSALETILISYVSSNGANISLAYTFG